jgi:hypothetical protein
MLKRIPPGFRLKALWRKVQYSGELRNSSPAVMRPARMLRASPNRDCSR